MAIQVRTTTRLYGTMIILLDKMLHRFDVFSDVHMSKFDFQVPSVHQGSTVTG